MEYLACAEPLRRAGLSAVAVTLVLPVVAPPPGKKLKASHSRYRALGPELIQVYSQPAGDLSHPPGGRLPPLSARPAVTFPVTEHHCPLAGTHLAVPWRVEGSVDLADLAPGGARNIVISTSVCVSVCLSVCLSTRISPKAHTRSLPNFVHVAYGRGPVLLRRHFMYFRFCGFGD